MSLTRFTGNTNVISELADAPTLTAEQLKAKFDEVDGSEKTFINNTLIPEIEQLIASEKATLQGLISNLGTQIRSEITANILADNQAKYHVGKIVMETENVNPATYLGFGTWQYWGSGKVPVGIDTSDTDFDEVEKTGGNKEQVLRAWIGAVNNNTGAIGYKIATPVTGSKYTDGLGVVGSTPGKINITNHSTIVSQSNGENASTVQPYITCYMWKRVS